MLSFIFIKTQIVLVGVSWPKHHCVVHAALTSPVSQFGKPDCIAVVNHVRAESIPKAPGKLSSSILIIRTDIGIVIVQI